MSEKYYSLTQLKSITRTEGNQWTGPYEIIHPDDLKKLKPADVRPVVLCRDCKFYSNGFCYNPNTFDDEKTRGNTSSEWFCADGRRREGGADNG